MRVIEERDDGAVLDFSTDELRLLFSVLAEVQGGPNAFDDADWDMLINQPRALEESLISSLQPVVARLTDKI
jgi:hypothetical protein